MLYVGYALNSVLMIAAPLVLGFLIARRFGARWALFGIGAVTFVASQVVHLPLLYGLTAFLQGRSLPHLLEAHALAFNAVVLGLASGLCEEIARYLVYRWWIKSARTWGEALMFGTGHGGIEAILLGGAAGLTLVTMISLRHVGATSLPVPTSQQAAVAKAVAEFWSMPWYDSLLGAVERAFALCLHTCLAVVVLQAVTRGRIVWLGVAILWHALANPSY